LGLELGALFSAPVTLVTCRLARETDSTRPTTGMTEPTRPLPIEMAIKDSSPSSYPLSGSYSRHGNRRPSRPWDVDFGEGNAYNHHLPPPDVYSAYGTSPEARVVRAGGGFGGEALMAGVDYDAARFVAG